VVAVTALVAVGHTYDGVVIGLPCEAPLIGHRRPTTLGVRFDTASAHDPRPSVRPSVPPSARGGERIDPTLNMAAEATIWATVRDPIADPRSSSPRPSVSHNGEPRTTCLRRNLPLTTGRLRCVALHTLTPAPCTAPPHAHTRMTPAPQTLCMQSPTRTYLRASRTNSTIASRLCARTSRTGVILEGRLTSLPSSCRPLAGLVH